MFRSSAMRLTALYTAIFALAVVELGAVITYSMDRELTKLFETSIRAESQALRLEYTTEGVNAVVFAVRDRDHSPEHMTYGLEGPAGRPIVGQLAGLHRPAGWSSAELSVDGGKSKKIRIFGVDLPQGYRLLVGDDLAKNAALERAVLSTFAIAFVAVLILGTLGGFILSRTFHKRLSNISGAAEAIIDGDLSRRVSLVGSGDDLDRLGATINSMLDRTTGLMDSLRHVTSDIAHDLRTPLHRLRSHLETGLAETSEEGRVQAMQRAMGEMEGVLDTFSALLRIAEVESGGRRTAFAPTDLSRLAAHVVEAFAPSAEEDGRQLVLGQADPSVVDGDPELLTQALVNLVENGCRHTPPGARVAVSVERSAGAVNLIVADNGPGIAAEERSKVFDRFYRLEASRTTPGSGLGLAMVAAVARLHGAQVRLEDAHPGLRAAMRFPLKA